VSKPESTTQPASADITDTELSTTTVASATNQTNTTFNMEAVTGAASTMIAHGLSFMFKFAKGVFKQLDPEVRFAATGAVLVPLGLAVLLNSLQPRQSIGLATLVLLVPMIGYALLATSIPRSKKRSRKRINDTKDDLAFLNGNIQMPRFLEYKQAR
jgi:hypothetical protein